ncbi:ASKHA domain-containing protein [Tissierella praeacuta]|uniref:ASKHA domain-containing protein n=1 Tax=Tissierella praeacuta TaxID=43131 RepID=UPI00333E2257
MPIVKFIKENINIEVEKGTVLLNAIREAKLEIETPCNGMGFCGKCKVIAKGQLSEPSDREKRIIDEKKSERLSCMTIVLGETEVELIEKNEKILKTINRGVSIDVSVDSPIKIKKLPDIHKNDSAPYADYLGYDFDSVKLYRKISMIEETNPREIWGVVFDNKLLDISIHKKNILGIAIDIGTTGISYYLMDLANGEIIEKLSSLNPQTQYGGDVLTRITYCMENPSGAIKLQELIVNEINNSIKRLAEALYNIDDIYHIIIAANTTMLHLLLGVNPSSLAKAPYRSIFLSPKSLKAKDISIEANDESILSIIPSSSSYVGGDIVSGIMASDFQNNNEALFIDIGTNGEMAVLKNGKIISTSTAAGPALEGMNIECGCRAEKGAIETFDIDGDFNISYTTIGNEKPLGICGSGLIDIAGALVKRNILLKSGRWNKNLDSKLENRLVDKKFYITENIYISQKDIRQIQLAKGAIAAGVILMLEEIDLKIEEISRVYIAGAFGYHVNPHNIKIIGLIPRGFNGEISFLGNTSLEGARLALINKECFENVYRIKDNMEVLELSLKENFQDVFVSQLNF